MLDTATPKGQCKKLNPPWRGPGIIIENISGAIFRVKVGNKFFVVNHDRIKLCQDRKLPVWIQRLIDNPQLLADCVPKKARDPAGPVYCICSKPDTGGFMIQCDSCLEWYHGPCIGVTPRVGKKIDKYKCPLCSADAGPSQGSQ